MMFRAAATILAVVAIYAGLILVCGRLSNVDAAVLTFVTLFVVPMLVCRDQGGTDY